MSNESTLHFGWLSSWLLVAAALLAMGCQQQPLSDAAKEFLKENQTIIDTLRPQLAGPLADEDDAATNQVLEHFWRKAQRDGHPITEGLLVLGGKGQVVGGRYPDPKDRSTMRRSEYEFNYSRYKDIAAVLDCGRTICTILYTLDHKVYLVCAPIFKGKEVVGALCIGRAPHVLGPPMKISDAEFLRLRFAD